VGDLSFDHALFLGSFLAATFAAALVAGLAGFAFGIVAAAVWLHILPPPQTVALIIGYGLIVQGYAVWKLRDALSWQRLWPFLLGGIPGVALGIIILRWTEPPYIRAAIGAVLVLYAIYSLALPTLKPVRPYTLLDVLIGFLNGLLGGLTGLAGIIVVIWSSLRGWPKDVQRTVFQPIGVATFLMSAVGLGTAGIVDAETGRLFLLGLPVLLVGTWLGLKLYGRLNEAAFRRVLLVLVLVSGAALILPGAQRQ
jgi:uncharacterized membrane protein YfcA